MAMALMVGALNLAAKPGALELAGAQVPDGSFVTGVPGQIKREVTPQQITGMRHTAEELVVRGKMFKDSGL